MDIVNADSPGLNHADWSDALRLKPLHFSWQDGRVAEVCASNSDPEWVLNIKRGIVSAMQVSCAEDAASLVEVRVFSFLLSAA